MIIDTAVIAAGGEGKRMKASGIMIPKPLVTFQGKSLISYVIDSLIENNITKIIILEPVDSSLKEILLAKYKDISLIFIKPEIKQTLLETLLLTEVYLPDKFILVDADIILKPSDLKKFITNIQQDCFGAIATVEKPKYQNNHYLLINNNQIREFNKESNIGSHGGYLYLFSKKILNKIRHELLIGNYSFSGLITKIARKEKIIPSYIDEIFDIDTYDELIMLENIFNN